MKVKVKAIHIEYGNVAVDYPEKEMDESEVDEYADNLAKAFKDGTLSVYVNDKHYAYYMNPVGWMG